ncbi:MAG: hypothetical protein ABSB49_02130 [Polyangia bacterium]|jgi:hypothetical protein
MADERNRDPYASKESDDGDTPPERAERGLSDRVRRAVVAGLEVASRSKDDLVRAASAEIGAWLDRVDVQGELAKVLANMVLEVKAEIRFRPREDGTLGAEVTAKSKVKDGEPQEHG